MLLGVLAQLLDLLFCQRDCCLTDVALDETEQLLLVVSSVSLAILASNGELVANRLGLGLQFLEGVQVRRRRVGFGLRVTATVTAPTTTTTAVPPPPPPPPPLGVFIDGAGVSVRKGGRPRLGRLPGSNKEADTCRGEGSIRRPSRRVAPKWRLVPTTRRLNATDRAGS